MKLAAQDKPDESSIKVSLETNANMLPNQEVGKLLSNVADTQANTMPNTGSPVDVEDPVQPAMPVNDCLLYTSPSPRDRQKSRMPSSA